MYWHPLLVQDPLKPHSSAKLGRPKTYSVSIKEYALVEPLGTGGFGTVWLARRRRTNDLTAIKVLSQADTRAREMTKAVRPHHPGLRRPAACLTLTLTLNPTLSPTPTP